MGPGVAGIEHVIVLVLENRSFDHLLGHLDHTAGDAFDGTAGHPELGNFLDPKTTTSTWYPVTDEATYTFPVDPDHEHFAVLEQLRTIGDRRNTGFVASYVHKALDTDLNENRRVMLRTWGRRLIVGGVGVGVLTWFWEPVVAGVALVVAVLGLVGVVATRSRRVTAAQEHQAEQVAPAIMAGFTPDKVPVLSTLALEFAVCQCWFASVPGETWPNRNFFHSATSSGSTDIELGFYEDRTIFENLDREWRERPRPGRAWHVYYGQFPPQVFFFTYVLERSIDHTGGLQDLLDDIDHGRLPAYSFVEPHHGLLGRQPSCSQHPGNNLTASRGVDFRSGERLVAEIYRHLQQHPDVFDKTVFVVTYDEHGGTYDHHHPPHTVAPESEHDTWSRRLMRWLSARRYPAGFDFQRLGPRVPAVVISPWIPRATLDSTVRDHSGVPATVRELFAPTAGFLTRRDRHAATFESLLTLDQPRRAPELPTLDDELHALGNPPLFPGDPSLPLDAPAPTAPSSAFDWQLVDLTHAIHAGTVAPAAQDPAGTRAALHAREPGAATPALRRRRIRPLRRQRLRAQDTSTLHQLLADTETALGAMAAEAGVTGPTTP